MAYYSDIEHKRKQEPIAFAETSSENTTGLSLSPPETFAPNQAPIQKKEAAPIQREEKEESDKKDSGVDVDIKLLPPSVQMSFWKFKLSADTGEAKLGFRSGNFSSTLGYGYGSDLSLGMKKGPFSLGANLNPGNLNYGMSAGYKQGPFNAGIGYNSSKQEGSLSMGYGAPLLPMPDVFGGAMQQGGDAATNMMMQGPMAPLQDPMGYYKANKDNIGDISKAAAMAAKLAKEGKGVKFGAGVRLSASQLGGFNLMLGVQGSF